MHCSKTRSLDHAAKQWLQRSNGENDVVTAAQVRMREGNRRLAH